MKINVITPCYNDEATIGAVIKCCQPFVNEHFVMLSEKPFFGEGCKPDRSEEIASDLGATVIKGSWPLDHHQRNLGIKISHDADWILTLDSDELFTKEGMESLVDYLSKSTDSAIGCQPECYWFDTDHVLSPKSTFDPIIAVRPSVKFTHIRNVDCGYVRWPGTMHHLSWCRPKDIHKKVIHYAHADDFKYAQEWYYQDFCNWKEGQYALMPDGTSYGVARQSLPDELKQLLEA